MEQKKCWELLAQSLTGFKLCAATTYMVCRQMEFLVNNVASVCIGPRRDRGLGKFKRGERQIEEKIEWKEEG